MNGLPEFWGGLFNTVYTPLWRADEVSELSWWLISAIHDEGLTLCEQLKES
jgi:hypothetical protein